MQNSMCGPVGMCTHACNYLIYMLKLDLNFGVPK